MSPAHLDAEGRASTGDVGTMEALTAVSVACLTGYGMVEAVDRDTRIEGLRLLEQSGGRSGAGQADGGQDQQQEAAK